MVEVFLNFIFNYFQCKTEFTALLESKKYPSTQVLILIMHLIVPEHITIYSIGLIIAFR